MFHFKGKAGLRSGWAGARLPSCFAEVRCHETDAGWGPPGGVVCKEQRVARSVRGWLRWDCEEVFTSGLTGSIGGRRHTLKSCEEATERPRVG